jgi:hypothetical protein
MKPYCLVKFTVQTDPSDVIPLKAPHSARSDIWVRLQWVKLKIARASAPQGSKPVPGRHCTRGY